MTSEGLTLQSLKADPTFSLFQPIAHEIAHLRWNFGAEHGDWLYEAFAEYYSAIAVQKVASELEFQSVVSNYEEQVRKLPSSTPSVANVAFQPGGDAFVVRYYKGALMRHSFRFLRPVQRSSLAPPPSAGSGKRSSVGERTS